MTKQHQRAAEKLAKQLGVTLVRSRVGNRVEVTCEAPLGKVWRCTGDIHELIASGYYGPWGWEFLYETLIADLKMGVDECRTVDCEWCGVL